MSAFDSLSKLFPLIGDEGMFAMQINYWISSIFTCLPNFITISGFAGKRRSGQGKYKIIAEIVGWPHIIQNWIRGQNAFNQSSPWWPWEWYFVHGHIITGYLQNISKRSKYLQLQAKFVNGIVLLRPLSNYLICCLCRKNEFLSQSTGSKPLFTPEQRLTNSYGKRKKSLSDFFSSVLPVMSAWLDVKELVGRAIQPLSSLVLG